MHVACVSLRLFRRLKRTTEALRLFCRCMPSVTSQLSMLALHKLKGHCIEFKYYADGIHSGLTPPV